jgi:hypothetical protein
MTTLTIKTNITRSAIFALLCLFAWTIPLAAENWIYVTRTDWDPGNDPAVNNYIDADSVVRNGDTLFFRALSVYDYVDLSGKKQMISKIEVNLAPNPWKSRVVEFWIYDSKGKEFVHDPARDNSFSTVYSGSLTYLETVAALKYAK